MAYKILAFSIGGGLAGMAGSFYAHYILFISPVTFTVAESINMLVMIIFGGMSTLFGPILGAVFLTVLPEFLRMAGSLRLVIYGVALVIFIIWMPLGVWGSLKSFWLGRRQASLPEVGEHQEHS
jgi:branched-chain amino acid transport system permease protein